MFCVVTVVRVYVLCYDSGTQESSWRSIAVMHHYTHARCHFRLDIEEFETSISPEFPNFLAGKSSRGCAFIDFCGLFHRVCIKRWEKSIKAINSDVIYYHQNPI